MILCSEREMDDLSHFLQTTLYIMRPLSIIVGPYPAETLGGQFSHHPRRAIKMTIAITTQYRLDFDQH